MTLTRYTPLRPKRSKPRASRPERLTSARQRPKASQGPSEEQRRFHAHLRGLPCQCGCGQPGTDIHHILANVPGKTRRRDHDCVVHLAAICHNLGTKSLHLLGSEAAFEREHGVDLRAVAVENLRLWRDAS